MVAKLSGEELARLAAPIVATMWANAAHTAVDKGDAADNSMIERAIVLAKKLHIAAHQQIEIR